MMMVWFVGWWKFCWGNKGVTLPFAVVVWFPSSNEREPSRIQTARERVFLNLSDDDDRGESIDFVVFAWAPPDKRLEGKLIDLY